MDYKFLHKVVDQIVRETRIDYDMGEIQFPFSSSYYSTSHHSSTLFYLLQTHFSDHCKNVYGLNEEETMYVWKEYKQIIISKIKTNG
jgi:hypothetical protein